MSVHMWRPHVGALMGVSLGWVRSVSNLIEACALVHVLAERLYDTAASEGLERTDLEAERLDGRGEGVSC